MRAAEVQPLQHLKSLDFLVVDQHLETRGFLRLLRLVTRVVPAQHPTFWRLGESRLERAIKLRRRDFQVSNGKVSAHGLDNVRSALFVGEPVLPANGVELVFAVDLRKRTVEHEQPPALEESGGHLLHASVYLAKSVLHLLALPGNIVVCEFYTVVSRHTGGEAKLA